MDTGLDQINQLIQLRQLWEAGRQLASLKAANPRVWGLDHRLMQVQQTLSIAQNLLDQANAALSQSNASKARALLKQAYARVIDLPDLEARLEQTKRHIAGAKAAAATAIARMNDGDIQAAWHHVQEARKLDSGSESIEALSLQVSQLFKQDIAKSQSDKRTRNISIVAMAVLVMVLGFGLLGLIHWVESSSQQSQALSQARSLCNKAYELIASEKFVDAKKSLQEALTALSELPTLGDDIRQEVTIALNSEAIVQGGNGLVPLDNKWITPQERQNALQVRAALRADIEEFRKTIELFRDGHVPSVPAATDPAHLAALTGLINQTREVDQLVMSDPDSARGNLQSLQRELDRTLVAHGFEKYNGQWMPQAQAFVERQRDKGLVLYDGQWITPEQKLTQEMIARGMVKDGEEWVTKAELDRRVLAKNEQAKEAESAKAREMAQEAARKAREAQRRAAIEYREFAAEARKINTHFAAGVTFSNYSERLALLVDAYASLNDKTSTLRPQADAVLTACRAVHSEWESNLRGRSSDAAVTRSMTQTSELIDVFLISFEQASRN